MKADIFIDLERNCIAFNQINSTILFAQSKTHISAVLFLLLSANEMVKNMVG